LGRALESTRRYRPKEDFLANSAAVKRPTTAFRRLTNKHSGRIDLMAQIVQRFGRLRYGGPMESLISDLRYAWRELRKRPGFALTAILSLALGIGATSA